MVKYRRASTPGAIYFFTLTLHDRLNTHLTTHIHTLRQAFHTTQSKYPFKTHALVILPDHLHALWELPEKDANYSLRWQRIKRLFTEKLIQQGIPLTKNRSGEYMLWQKRFWEHLIRDAKDYETHVNYIHYNPVKHGLVTEAGAWPYSSLHRLVMRGVLDTQWLNVARSLGTEGFGER